jgi:tetratricopeptide (TPR) repeat protein
MAAAMDSTPGVTKAADEAFERRVFANIRSCRERSQLGYHEEAEATLRKMIRLVRDALTQSLEGESAAARAREAREAAAASRARAANNGGDEGAEVPTDVAAAEDDSNAETATSGGSASPETEGPAQQAPASSPSDAGDGVTAALRVTAHRRLLAISLSNLAMILKASGSLPKAVRAAREALDLEDEIRQRNAGSALNLCVLYTAVAKYDQALSMATRAQNILAEKDARDPMLWAALHYNRAAALLARLNSIGEGTPTEVLNALKIAQSYAREGGDSGTALLHRAEDMSENVMAQFKPAEQPLQAKPAHNGAVHVSLGAVSELLKPRRPVPPPRTKACHSTYLPSLKLPTIYRQPAPRPPPVTGRPSRKKSGRGATKASQADTAASLPPHGAPSPMAQTARATVGRKPEEEPQRRSPPPPPAPKSASAPASRQPSPSPAASEKGTSNGQHSSSVRRESRTGLTAADRRESVAGESVTRSPPTVNAAETSPHSPQQDYGSDYEDDEEHHHGDLPTNPSRAPTPLSGGEHSNADESTSRGLPRTPTPDGNKQRPSGSPLPEARSPGGDSSRSAPRRDASRSASPHDPAAARSPTPRISPTPRRATPTPSPPPHDAYDDEDFDFDA